MTENRKNKERGDSIETTKNKKKRKLKPSYVVIAVLALALAGSLAYFLWPGEVEEAPPANVRGTVPIGNSILLTPENLDEVRQQLAEPIPDAQYTVSMTTNWVFDNPRTPSRNASVDNLPSNSRTVYFDVILDDTGETVLSSPYIPLGGTFENFALDADLSAGVYDATVTFFLVDDDHEVITDVSVSVTLTING